MTPGRARVIDDFRHPGAARRRFVLRSTGRIGRIAFDCAVAGPGVK
jgi:hypothetical protein